MKAYLDNGATTPLCRQALDRCVEGLTECFGNPSSLHYEGNAAAKELTNARRSAAKLLRCEPEEIIFTGSGTLSNNTAVFGSAHALKRRGNRIVTTSVEHPSVEESMKALEKEGFEVIRLPVDKYGYIDRESLFNAINSKTVLVSMMLVNNEVGSEMPVRFIRKAVEKAGAEALIHTDAVQAFGKMPIRPFALGVDLLSASAHKINGPKGVGLLYVRKGVRLVPFVSGAGQEGGIYSGTQPMPAILGFAGAIDALPDLSEQLERMRLLRDRTLEALEDMEGITINSRSDAFPYIINFSAPGHPSQTMLNYLSERGVCLSAGSACSKGHRSSVLKSMGLEAPVIDSALRISYSRFTTEEETDYFILQLKQALKEMRT